MPNRITTETAASPTDFRGVFRRADRAFPTLLYLSQTSHRSTIISEGQTEAVEKNTVTVACYVWVSSRHQKTDGQEAEIRKWLSNHGIDPAKVTWFVDK